MKKSQIVIILLATITVIAKGEETDATDQRNSEKIEDKSGAPTNTTETIDSKSANVDENTPIALTETLDLKTGNDTSNSGANEIQAEVRTEDKKPNHIEEKSAQVDTSDTDVQRSAIPINISAENKSDDELKVGSGVIEVKAGDQNLGPPSEIIKDIENLEGKPDSFGIPDVANPMVDNRRLFSDLALIDTKGRSGDRIAPHGGSRGPLFNPTKAVYDSFDALNEFGNYGSPKNYQSVAQPILNRMQPSVASGFFNPNFMSAHNTPPLFNKFGSPEIITAHNFVPNVRNSRDSYMPTDIKGIDHYNALERAANAYPYIPTSQHVVTTQKPYFNRQPYDTFSKFSDVPDRSGYRSYPGNFYRPFDQNQNLPIHNTYVPQRYKRYVRFPYLRF